MPNLSLSEAELMLRNMLVRVAADASHEKHYVGEMRDENPVEVTPTYRSTSQGGEPTVAAMTVERNTVRRGLFTYRSSRHCTTPVVVWFTVTGDEFEIHVEYLVQVCDGGNFTHQQIVAATTEAVAALEEPFRRAQRWY